MRRTTGLIAALILGALMALPVAPRAQSKADVALRAATLSGWFPDGRSLLISGTDSQGKDAFVRYYVDPPRVEPLPPMGWRWKRQSLSPDGKVAFASVGGKQTSSLNAFDLVSGDTRVVVRPGLNFVQGLAVAPDGGQLAYVENTDEEIRLWIVDVDGGVPRQIAALKINPTARALAWLPDGRHLLLANYDPAGKKTEIWRVSVDDGTSQFTGLTVDGISNGLSVSADGRQLAIDGSVSKTEGWILENFLPKPAIAPGVKVK